jgi:hypothetical protein
LMGFQSHLACSTRCRFLRILWANET